jgi:hypothetical protein
MKPLSIALILTLSPFLAKGFTRQEITGFHLSMQPVSTNQFLLLNADKAVASLDGHILGLENVSLEIHQLDGKIVRTISGHSARLDLLANEVVIDEKQFISLKNLQVGSLEAL